MVPRTYPDYTPLGRAMRGAGLTASRVSALSGVHNRTLTELLAGRIEPLPEHRARLSDVLGMAPEELFPMELVSDT